MDPLNFIKRKIRQFSGEADSIYVYWWTVKDFKNFGDELGPLLVSRLSGKRIVFASGRLGFTRILRSFIKGILSFGKNQKAIAILRGWISEGTIFSIGSIIEHNFCEKNIIWGSGLIDSASQPRSCKILAVRGEHTRNCLMRLGFDVPAVFGDPALLFPLIIEGSATRTNDWILIPHFSHYETVRNSYNLSRDKILSLAESPLEVIEKITQARRVLSSSLHGIIVAHAYGIPALFVKFPNCCSLDGDDIKFRDYFSSVGIKPYAPIEIDDSVIRNVESLFLQQDSRALPSVNLDTIRRNLLRAAPFPLRPEIRKLIAPEE